MCKCAFDLVLWKKASERLSVNPDIRYYEMAEYLDCTEAVAQGIVIDWREMNGLKGRGNPRGGLRKQIVKTKSEINKDYYDKHQRTIPIADIKYVSRSVASQNKYLINPNNQ